MWVGTNGLVHLSQLMGRRVLSLLSKCFGIKTFRKYLVVGLLVSRWLKAKGFGAVFRFKKMSRHWPLDSRQVKAKGFGTVFWF